MVKDSTDLFPREVVYRCRDTEILVYGFDKYLKISIFTISNKYPLFVLIKNKLNPLTRYMIRSLTLKALTSFYINDGDQRVFFNLKSS